MKFCPMGCTEIFPPHAEFVAECTMILWLTVSNVNLHEAHSPDAFGNGTKTLKIEEEETPMRH